MTSSKHPANLQTNAVNPCAACPLWDSCSATLCPLDTNRSEARTLKGERVCRQLLRAARGEKLPVAIAPTVLSALHDVTEGVLGGSVVRGKVTAAGRKATQRPGPQAMRGIAVGAMH